MNTITFNGTRILVSPLGIAQIETLQPKKETYPVMYIFLNKGLGMSLGKSAAQAAHAAIEAFGVSDFQLIEDWYLGGHYTKLVMEARDEAHLKTIQTYLESRGFKTEMIIDEGMTEIDPHQTTALGVAIVDRNDPHTKATFGSFKLYKDTVEINLKINR